MTPAAAWTPRVDFSLAVVPRPAWAPSEEISLLGDNLLVLMGGTGTEGSASKIYWDVWVSDNLSENRIFFL